MGVNSFGVAIGNEAVFTKARRGPEALTGMDLLRLALERSQTAKQAVEIIIELLTKYGQGGNCGYDHKFFYDNSFIAADKTEGYILETSGKKYITKRIAGMASISNRLSIQEFTHNSEPVYTYFSGSKQRQAQTGSALSNMKGNISAAMIADVLRTHDPKARDKELGGTVRSVCMHAGGLLGDQTTGSVIIELDTMKMWATGASLPCLSVFKPIGFEPVVPVFSEGEEKRAIAYWFAREKLIRSVQGGYIGKNEVRKGIAELEKESFFNAEDWTQHCVDISNKEREFISSFDTSNWQNAAARHWQKRNDALAAQMRILL